MERKKASRVYLWLWLSPLLTVPTLIFGIAAWWFGTFDSTLIPFLLPALWHLVLLRHARNKESALVRWHGRQALALVGLSTLAVLVTWLVVRWEEEILFSLPVIALIWLVGNIWGQRQAKRGDCSLAQWLGHGDELPSSEEDVESLMKIIRFNHNQEKRAKALEKLKELGMVEDL